MDIVTSVDGSLWVVDQVVEVRSDRDAIEDESQKLRVIFASEGFTDDVPGSFAIYRDVETGRLFEETLTDDPDFPAHFREVDIS